MIALWRKAELLRVVSCLYSRGSGRNLLEKEQKKLLNLVSTSMLQTSTMELIVFAYYRRKVPNKESFVEQCKRSGIYFSPYKTILQTKIST